MKRMVCYLLWVMSGPILADDYYRFTIDTSKTGLGSNVIYCAQVYSQQTPIALTGTAPAFSIASSSSQPVVPLNNGVNTLDFTISSSSGLTAINGGIMTLYVVPQGSPCPGYVTSPLVPAAGNFGGSPNPFQPYGLFEFTFPSAGQNGTVDISNVDIFTVPMNFTVNSPVTGGFADSVGLQIGESNSGSSSTVFPVLVNNYKSNYPSDAGLIMPLTVPLATGSGKFQGISNPYHYLLSQNSGSGDYPFAADPMNFQWDQALKHMFYSADTIVLSGAASANGNSPVIANATYNCTPTNSLVNGSYSYPANAPITGGFPNGVYPFSAAALQCTTSPSNGYTFNIFSPFEMVMMYDEGNPSTISSSQNPLYGKFAHTSCSGSEQDCVIFTFTDANGAAQPLSTAGTDWLSTLNSRVTGGLYATGTGLGESIGTPAVTYPARILQINQSGGQATGVILSYSPGNQPVAHQIRFSQVPDAVQKMTSRGAMVLGSNYVFADGNYQYHSNTGSSDGRADVIGSLEDALNQALNRGAYNSSCWTNAASCFEDQSTWYEGNYNPYSKFLHVQSQSQYVKAYNRGVNPKWAMAYGFGMDETPATGAPVPTKWDSIFPRSSDANNPVTGTLTLTPWVSSSSSNILTVGLSGNGISGSQVTASLQSGSGVAGFVCPDTCNGTYDSGATVLLTAKSSATSTFNGWSSSTTTLNCPGTQLTCIVTMTQAQTVIATFTAVTPGNYPLDVNVSGPGYVTSTPGSISCGPTRSPQQCTQQFASGTTVTLSATPTGSGVFVGWTGCSSSSGTTCTALMNQAQNVRASFGSPTDYTLTITTGVGGTVTGTSGVNVCSDATCIDTLAPNTQVSLYASSVSGYKFSGWGGACASFGTGTCSLDMSSNQAVSAAFTSIPSDHESLSVHLDGSGSVTGSEINCPTACNQEYAYSTVVSLAASPSSGYQFAGWYGSCTSTSTTCSVTMDKTQSVTARFVRSTPPPPKPIPTLNEWARLLLVFTMIASAGWYGRRLMKH